MCSFDKLVVFQNKTTQTDMNSIGSLTRDCSANNLSITRTINLRVCFRSNNGFAYNLLKDKSKSYNVYTMYMNVLSRKTLYLSRKKASSFCIKRNVF